MKAGLYDDKLNEIASCSAEYGLITEGGEALADREGISPLGIKDGKAAFMLGSGKYSFRVE